MLDVGKLTASLWPEQVSLSLNLNLHLPKAEVCRVYFIFSRANPNIVCGRYCHIQVRDVRGICKARGVWCAQY